MNYLYFMVMVIIIGITAVLSGLLMALKPDLAIEIQRRFYERINWRISPVSMDKEIRNTRIMGVILIILSLFIFIIGVSCAFGEDSYQRGDSSSGTENINIGPAATVMVPKGAKVNTKDGVIRVESAGAFSGRKFQDVEARLDKIEENQQELRNKVDELIEIVDNLQKKDKK